jgi:Protein of unknown function (DUF1194)
MRLILGAILLAGGLLAGDRALADQVDVQIVFAADVSRSVDNDEFRLQREGCAAAIADPRVIGAIAAGPRRAIAVSFVEWSGVAEQRVVADWTIVRDEETAAVFAAALRAAPRSFANATAIGSAIDFAVKHIAASGHESERRIIDISGDGDNNVGRPVEYARDDAVAGGITINGLAIINLHPAIGFIAHVQPPGGMGEYYRTRVIGGPGAFVITIDDYTSFAEAIASKLAREIAASQSRRLAQGER